MADNFYFNKDHITKDSRFHLEFVSGYVDEKSQAEIIKLIDTFIKNADLEDTFTNVRMIRTILNGFNVQEEKLRMAFETKNSFEFVDYKNKKMTRFEKRCGKKKFEMEVFGETPRVNSSEFDELESKSIENEAIDLMEFNIIDLVNESEYKDIKTLIKLYELFYGIKPNFNNKKSLAKMKEMLPILKFFDISLPHDSKDEFETFINTGIEQIYSELFPLRDDYDTSFSLDEKYSDKDIEKIKYIGEVVLESITDTNELKRISNIFYKAYSQMCLGYYSTSRYSCNEEEKKIGFEIIQKVNQRTSKKDRH